MVHNIKPHEPVRPRKFEYSYALLSICVKSSAMLPEVWSTYMYIGSCLTLREACTLQFVKTASAYIWSRHDIQLEKTIL